MVALAPNEVRVLAALLRVDTPLTGRSVARVTGLSQSTAQRALTRLSERGLVVADAAPPALLYRVNHDHLALPAVQGLLHLDEDLRARMSEHVADWRVPARAVIVYGSVARGDATASSDLDVLVVREDGTEAEDPDWQHQVVDLTDAVRRWTGRRISVVEISGSEAGEGLASGEPYLVEADREGWLIAGRGLRELA